jgi:gluconolactonase
MKRFILLSALASLAFVTALGALTRPRSPDDDKKSAETLGKLESRDPAFDDLISPDAKLEILAKGHDWCEGPVWVPRDGGFLLWSDIPRNRIYKWQEGKGESVFMEPSGGTGKDAPLLKEPGTNGLMLDPDGRLVMMEHGDRRVTRLDSWDGKEKSALAHRYMGKRLNSPNDGVFKSNGDLYFTDPPYGRSRKKQEGEEFPDRELDFCGVYRLSKSGELTLLTREMSKPNGIALSPDEKTLYVANSDPAKAIWMAFPVKSDGTLGEGRVFFDATSMMGKDRPGLPDGMKVDAKGNVFATGPGGVLVFTAQGKHLGTIFTGVPTANCGWGNDGSVLYVCADKAMTRIKTKTRGKGF